MNKIIEVSIIPLILNKKFEKFSITKLFMKINKIIKIINKIIYIYIYIYVEVYNFYIDRYFNIFIVE